MSEIEDRVRADALLGWTREQFAEAAGYFEEKNGWLPIPGLAGAHEVLLYWLENRTLAPQGQVLFGFDEWLHPLKPMNERWARLAMARAWAEIHSPLGSRRA